MVTVGDLIYPAGVGPEDWAKVRTYRPPFWCAACDVGQSIEHCWICAEKCEPTPGKSMAQQPGSLGARSMSSPCVIVPEDDEITFEKGA